MKIELKALLGSWLIAIAMAAQGAPPPTAAGVPPLGGTMAPGAVGGQMAPGPVAGALNPNGFGSISAPLLPMTSAPPGGNLFLDPNPIVPRGTYGIISNTGVTGSSVIVAGGNTPGASPGAVIGNAGVGGTYRGVIVAGGNTAGSSPGGTLVPGTGGTMSTRATSQSAVIIAGGASK